MTDEERKATQKIIRVGINLGVLLDVGMFPGQHAFGITECQEMVKGIVAEAQQRLNSLTPPPAPLPPPAAPAAQFIVPSNYKP
jgi:hypothetical protein